MAWGGRRRPWPACPRRWYEMSGCQPRNQITYWEGLYSSALATGVGPSLRLMTSCFKDFFSATGAAVARSAKTQRERRE